MLPRDIVGSESEPTALTVQESALDRIGGELDGSVVGGRGLVHYAGACKQVGSCRVVRLVLMHRCWVNGTKRTEGNDRPPQFAKRDGAVQCDGSPKGFRSNVRSMNVVDAVHHRSSIRAFLPDAIEDETIRALLADAARAPSGGNLQPWRIYVVNGPSMPRLREHLDTQPPMEQSEYDIYPKPLSEPYRTNRYTNGEQLYATLEIPREDRDARLRQFARNGEFFGAPAALFCFVDRQMGPPQWSDLGMFLQTFMLLAVEQGLATCAQEYWSVRHGAIRSFVGAPDNEMLFCGMAIGKADGDATVNTLRTDRMPLDDWVMFA